MNQKEKALHKDFHEAAAASHAELAKCAANCAEIHAGIAKTTELTNPSESKAHTALADVHKSAAAEHVKAGEFHIACAKSVGDLSTDEIAAESSSDVKALCDRVDKFLSNGIPNGVRAIPSMIPRIGQPTKADRDSAANTDVMLAPVIGDIPA